MVKSVSFSSQLEVKKNHFLILIQYYQCWSVSLLSALLTFLDIYFFIVAYFCEPHCVHFFLTLYCCASEGAITISTMEALVGSSVHSRIFFISFRIFSSSLHTSITGHSHLGWIKNRSAWYFKGNKGTMCEHILWCEREASCYWVSLHHCVQFKQSELTVLRKQVYILGCVTLIFTASFEVFWYICWIFGYVHILFSGFPLQLFRHSQKWMKNFWENHLFVQYRWTLWMNILKYWMSYPLIFKGSLHWHYHGYTITKVIKITTRVS